MGEAQSGFDLRQYKLEQLKISAQVMPDSWFGHAKIAIEEKDISDRKKAEALRKTRERLE